MIDLNKLIVLDIETLINCFIVCCRDVKTGSKKEFVFYDDPQYADQPLAFYKFLRTCVRNDYTFVTFNGLGFDVQVLHYFYDWCQEHVDPLYELETKEVIRFLYEDAQRLINTKEEDRFKAIVPEHDLFIPVIDLYKQKHFDRTQRATSLKWVQFVMRRPRIGEMPHNHDTHITKDQIADVLEYCWEDVDSTYDFYQAIKFETEVRLALSKEYGRNLINASEPRMAREIFGVFLCKEMGITYEELKKQRTLHKQIAFKDIIFPYVQFRTPELQKVHNDFKNTVIDASPQSKLDFAYSFDYHGLTVYLGLGGIHSCVPAGVYKPADDEIFQDDDVVSFYPQLGIKNNIRPAHLGDVFSRIYSDLFDQRQLIPKSDPKNYIFKILLNSAYGLSSEINSYFYDRKYTYGITVNGQLSLLMLVEALSMSVPDIRFIQMNTDGITYIYKKQYADKVEKIRQWWCKVTKLKFDTAYYAKMVIADVNNYLAIYTDGKLKKKGIFDVTTDYHKNPSYLIIPKALEQYYVKGQDIKSYVLSPDHSIFDYCGGVKKKKNFTLNLYKDFGNMELCEEQQKVTRYAVTQKTDDAGVLVKDFHDGRKTRVLADALVTPLNDIKPDYTQAGRYNLDYNWYVKECKKIIDGIQPPTIQNTLF